MDHVIPTAHRLVALWWEGIQKRVGGVSPARLLAVVVALSLWVGAGGLTASSAPTVPAPETFGEMHWYGG